MKEFALKRKAMAKERKGNGFGLKEKKKDSRHTSVKNDFPHLMTFFTRIGKLLHIHCNNVAMQK